MNFNKIKLLSLKVDSEIKFRYIVLNHGKNPPEQLLLFIGGDVLNNANNVLATSYSRIHARYAKKGLATKVVFPPDVAVEGIPNLSPGTWFYSLQGLLQLVFEFCSRNIQVSITSKIGNLWQSSIGNPTLPNVLQVSVEQINVDLENIENEDVIGHLLKVCRFFKGTTKSFSPGNKPQQQRNSKNNNSPTVEEEVRPPTSWSSLLQKLIRLTSQVSCEEGKHGELASSLQSFLRLLKHETDKPSGDSSAIMLLHILTNYSSIVCDPSSLKKFRNTWGISEKENALLCLVGEWMGKRMCAFTENIAQKVDDFKVKNIDKINDLPPPQILIENLFPLFMKLLIGHWIGLYKSGEDGSSLTVETPNNKSLKPRNNRDHSYSSAQKKEVPEECSSSSSPRSNRVDHSYFSPVVESSTTSTSQQQLLQQSTTEKETTKKNKKKDHSYSVTKEVITSSSNYEESKKSKDLHKSTEKRGVGDDILASLRKRRHHVIETEPSSSKKSKLSEGKDKSKDHTYSTSSVTTVSTPVIVSDNNSAAAPSSTKKGLDHTYVSSNNPDSSTTQVDEHESTDSRNRKDHTYFVSHSKRVKSPGTSSSSKPSSSQSSNETATSTQLPSKRSKAASSSSSSSSNQTAAISSSSNEDFSAISSSCDLNFNQSGNSNLDPSKYPFVQLILEFMNNALISGLSHVVYSRLSHSL